MKDGKSAAEGIKVDMKTAIDMLSGLFSRIWEEEIIPEDWREGILINIPKMGDHNNCNNYRGIILLSVSGKVLNRFLLGRMSEAVDPTL